MQKRSPLAVFFLSLITLGIYAIYWEVKTKGELVSKGAEIPTSWLIIVPLANLYWAYKYCEGVDKVTQGKVSTVLALLLVLVLGIVGIAILQAEYNKLGEIAAAPVTPEVAPAAPAAVEPVTPTETPAAPAEPDTAPPSDPSAPTPQV